MKLRVAVLACAFALGGNGLLLAKIDPLCTHVQTQCSFDMGPTACCVQIAVLLHARAPRDEGERRDALPTDEPCGKVHTVIGWWCVWPMGFDCGRLVEFRCRDNPVP